MSKKPSLEQRLKAYEKWLSGLTEHDRMNFETLISLPNAEQIVARCPEGQYRDMATFALALKMVAGRLQMGEETDA
jgi:hypothetical protein